SPSRLLSVHSAFLYLSAPRVTIGLSTAGSRSDAKQRPAGKDRQHEAARFWNRKWRTGHGPAVRRPAQAAQVQLRGPIGVAIIVMIPEKIGSIVGDDRKLTGTNE